MLEWEKWGIIAVVGAAFLGWVYCLIMGPAGPLSGDWKKQIAELEVKTRMESDEALVDDLQILARLYVRTGRRTEAEHLLRRALIISKQQWGESSPLTLAVLQESANLMDSMRRRAEATQFRREIKRIKTGKDDNDKLRKHSL